MYLWWRLLHNTVLTPLRWGRDSLAEDSTVDAGACREGAAPLFVRDSGGIPGRSNGGSLKKALFLWGDRGFESCSLQQPVCLNGEPRGCKRKAPHFRGGLRVAGDVRRDVHAANRDSFALSL